MKQKFVFLFPIDSWTVSFNVNKFVVYMYSTQEKSFA